MEKQTSLYKEHVRAGARMVEFAGFEMPIQYTGIIDEHQAVRSAVGLFDLSHMGEFRISGNAAAGAIDRLLTNDILDLLPGEVRYSPMCYPDGGVVDDLLVYRLADHFMLVVNASNIEKDLAWVREHAGPDVEVTDVSNETSLIAVQGPQSERVLQRHSDVALGNIRYYHFQSGAVAGRDTMISRTGYTGEDGFELYLANGDAPAVWRALLDDAGDTGLKPIGLGARDTLRLEAGYMLYGNDIDQTTTPLEAGLGWTVKFGSRDFIGREALGRQKTEGVSRRMVAVDMQDRAIPRPHFPLIREGRTIGELTSGTFSPTLGRGIGLGYVESDARVGTEIEVEIRNQPHPARLARKPMYKREGA